MANKKREILSATKKIKKKEKEHRHTQGIKRLANRKIKLNGNAKHIQQNQKKMNNTINLPPDRPLLTRDIVKLEINSQ